MGNSTLFSLWYTFIRMLRHNLLCWPFVYDKILIRLINIFTLVYLRSIKFHRNQTCASCSHLASEIKMHLGYWELPQRKSVVPIPLWWGNCVSYYLLLPFSRGLFLFKKSNRSTRLHFGCAIPAQLTYLGNISSFPSTKGMSYLFKYHAVLFWSCFWCSLSTYFHSYLIFETAHDVIKSYMAGLILFWAFNFWSDVEFSFITKTWNV